MATRAKIKPPKIGDTVNYVFHEHSGPNAHKIVPAKVSYVHEGEDGRVINVEVPQKDESLKIGPVPYREHDEENIQGNTWHFADADEEASEPKPKAKAKDDKKD